MLKYKHQIKRFNSKNQFKKDYQTVCMQQLNKNEHNTISNITNKQTKNFFHFRVHNICQNYNHQKWLSTSYS